MSVRDEVVEHAGGGGGLHLAGAAERDGADEGLRELHRARLLAELVVFGGVERDEVLLVRDLLGLQQLLELSAELAALFRVHLDHSHDRESLMAGSLKTEAVVLRSMRYAEADRILHLYTPHRGRGSAIAKGVRRTRSRFGGRLEPYFRL